MKNRSDSPGQRFLRAYHAELVSLGVGQYSPGLCYIETPAVGPPDIGLAPLLDWMRARLHEPLTVTALARHANLTQRTLIRRFHATTGTTPVKWLNAQRVQRARELLESSTMPVDQIARSSGLGGPANFRRHFTMAVGVNPSTYRSTFNAHAARQSRQATTG